MTAGPDPASRSDRPAGSRRVGATRPTDTRPADTRAAPALPAGGGLLLVDKPSGCTSHDVVGRLRHVLKTRRIGHAGTLDPMATGLLVLAVDRSTKLLGHLALTDKTYLATIRLGQRTDTDDADGLITESAPTTGVHDDDIRAGLAALTGPLLQVPSSVSAIKVAGRRAYDLVRAGETVQLAARPVTVTRFELLAPPLRSGDVIDLDVAVDCTTGTYIRSLARDLGVALGVGGHLTRLRRTVVGPFDVADAVDVFGADVFGADRSGAAVVGAVVHADPGTDRPVGRRGVPRPPATEAFAASIAAAVIPAAAAVRRSFPIRTVDADQARALGHGRGIEPAGIPGIYGAFGPAQELLALVREKGGTARSVLGWQVAG